MKSKHNIDNRANQLNPRHPSYWQSRGRPSDEAEQLTRQFSGESESDQRSSESNSDSPSETNEKKTA